MRENIRLKKNDGEKKGNREKNGSFSGKSYERK